MQRFTAVVLVQLQRRRPSAAAEHWRCRVALLGRANSLSCRQTATHIIHADSLARLCVLLHISLSTRRSHSPCWSAVRRLMCLRDTGQLETDRRMTCQWLFSVLRQLRLRVVRCWSRIRGVIGLGRRTIDSNPVYRRPVVGQAAVAGRPSTTLRLEQALQSSTAFGTD